MELLQQLQQIPGPSGDEGHIADFVQQYCRSISDCVLRREGDLILATRGTPRVAIFAHLDTIGFTQGYDRALLPIGGPHVEGDEAIREGDGPGVSHIRLKLKDERPTWRVQGKLGRPGSRWVYADPLVIKKDKVSGPYLDNRAGVWNALRVLERVANVAVVFTPGEEHSGRGALVGARLIYEELDITRALISDITWHTDSIKCGKGPAVSLRDRYVPRRRFLDEVLAAAADSGIPFQREVEGNGSSDGGWIERSTFPIDWAFVGAPQKRSHTPHEECSIADLRNMLELFVSLVSALHR